MLTPTQYEAAKRSAQIRADATLVYERAVKAVLEAEKALAPIKARHDKLTEDIRPMEKEVEQYTNELKENTAEIRVWEKLQQAPNLTLCLAGDPNPNLNL